MMRELFKTFVGLAMFAGAVQYLCPAGGARNILKLLCTAILTAAVLSSMGTFDYDLLSLEEARFALAEAEISERSLQTSDSLKKLLLEENCEKYMKSSAQELGLHIQSAAIELIRNGDGQWLPYAVQIEASGSEAAAQQLCRLLDNELGIPTERQVWTLYG